MEIRTAAAKEEQEGHYNLLQQDSNFSHNLSLSPLLTLDCNAPPPHVFLFRKPYKVIPFRGYACSILERAAEARNEKQRPTQISQQVCI